MPGMKYPLSLVIRAVDGVTKPLESINAKLEKTGARMSAPFARLGNSLGALGRAAGLPAIADSLGRTRDAAGALGSKLAGLGGLLAGVFTGATLGGLGLVSLVRSAEEAGSRLNDMSTRTGLSVQSFAELEYAAKKAGVEGDAFAGGMEKFNKSLSEAKRNTGPLAELLNKVGPEYLKQLKNVKSNEEAFGLLAKAMGKLESPGRRAELAAAAFGKAGLGMVNALKDGPDGVNALRAEFRKLAGDQTAFAQNSDALGDSFDALEISLLGVRNVAAGALMPAITSLTTAVTAFVVRNRDGIQQWAERAGKAIQAWIDSGGVDRLVSGLGKLADTAGALIDRVGGLGNALGLVAVAMSVSTVTAAANLGAEFVGLGKETYKLSVKLGGALLSALGKAALGILSFNFGPMIAGFRTAALAVKGFTASLLTNPIGILVGAIGLAAYLIYENWGPISGFFKDLWQTITFYTAQAWGWISETASTVWGGIVSGIMGVWEPVKAWFSDLWGGIVEIFQSAWKTIGPIVDGAMAIVSVLPKAALVSQGLGATNLGVFEPRSFGASTALGAAQALPAPAVQGGASTVRVDFANLPRGARVTPDRPGAVDLNLGYSLAPGT